MAVGAVAVTAGSASAVHFQRHHHHVGVWMWHVGHGAHVNPKLDQIKPARATRDALPTAGAEGPFEPGPKAGRQLQGRPMGETFPESNINIRFIPRA